MAPDLSNVEAAIIDLCAQVEAQMGGLRRDYQHSIYEICTSLHNRIAKEMDLMVGHIRRLIDQNAFLYDRVVELEKRDDPEKVRGRPGVILGREKVKIYSDSDNPEVLDALRWPGGRRKVPGRIRQTG